MKLHSLLLNNFRRYEIALLHFHPNFTVLIGENGKGKTTVLDAIAIMLRTYFQGSGITTGQGGIKKSDARVVLQEKGGQVFLEQQKIVFLNADATIHGNKIKWYRFIGDRGGRAKELVDIGLKDRERITTGNPDLPLLLYYGSGRPWNIHRKVETEKPGSQLDAYRYCLDPKSDHKAFEKWFKKLSLSALQKRKRSPALDVVEKSVISCIPDAEKFYHDAELDQILIKLTSEGYVYFSNLSDGYRNMVAMVADIAHRASRLNPHLEVEAATHTKGIVLIDEIDLHLHPKWQRRVVRDLQNTFPAMQFIATTHSPFIIQSLDAGEVIDLNRSVDPELVTLFPDGIAAPGPADTYSDRSIEDIAEEVMGVEIPQRSERYQQMYEVAKRYYELLEQAQGASENEKAKLKAQLDELSAPFSDNIAYHAFLEMERLAAGLGKTEQAGGES